MIRWPLPHFERAELAICYLYLPVWLRRQPNLRHLQL